jgi:dimethylamine monooxygenase subunit A
VSLARPVYFPVRAEPLRMQPGLLRFGTDFGNGASDAQFFPRDPQHARYTTAKRRVLAAHPDRFRLAAVSETDHAAVEAARQFIVETAQREGHPDWSALGLFELGAELAEDFAVLTREDRTVLVHVCFPSGWRPDAVSGQSFVGIHRHVPAFRAVAEKSASLLQAMLSRGPYVRFVWTITADDELDHHPEEGLRAAWTEQTLRGFLRVERQTTVPLAGGAASLFLIRTYLYEFSELTDAQRETLAAALAQMPQEIAEYKQLTRAIPRALALLG